MFKILLLLFLSLSSLSAQSSSACQQDIASLISEKSVSLKSAYPQNIKKISINEGISRIAELYPESVTHYKEIELSNGLKKDIYVIDSEDLFFNERVLLKNEYVEVMSHDAISFPLINQPKHLVMRTGTKIYDLLTDVVIHEHDFYLPWDGVFEVFIKLENKNFEYLKHSVQTNIDQFLKGQRHFCSQGRNGDNCVSWISRLDISKDKKLWEHLGINLEERTHIRTGRFLSHLVHEQNKDELPFLVYWTETKKTREEIKSLIQNWNFNFH